MFASMIKSSVKKTWRYVADVKSRQHVQAKNNGGVRVINVICCSHMQHYYLTHFTFIKMRKLRLTLVYIDGCITLP